MKPTANRVLVKELAQIVKKGEKAKPNSVMHAEVIRIGIDVKNIKAGDTVVFAPYGIDEVMVGGEKHLIVSEELIIATYEQKKSSTKTKG